MRCKLTQEILHDMRCKLCVMKPTRPDHVYQDGVCPACLNAQKKKENIDWAQRQKELHQLLDKFHGEVLVPSSAGKDSHAQAITLKNMGANVTAITARTCMLSDVGRKNIDNLARHVRTIEYTPNMTVRAKLNRLGLELVGDASLPEHYAIFSTPFRASVDLGIPLVMYGENSQMEYGGPQGSEMAREMTQRWTHEFGGFLGVRPKDFIGVEGITAKDMDDYISPSAIVLSENKTEAHFLGAYIKWDSHANARLAKEYGMIQVKPTEGNFWDHENLDNIETGCGHDFFMYLKYGYSRGTTQISVDIRNGLISREEALKWVEQTEHLFPEYYMGIYYEEVLDRIGMTKERFWEIAGEHNVQVKI